MSTSMDTRKVEKFKEQNTLHDLLPGNRSWYHFRSGCDKIGYDLHKLDVLLRDQDGMIKSYIISKEKGKGKFHIHSVMGFELDLPEAKARQFIKELFDVKGNKDYSFVPVKKLKQCMSYIQKDGEYLYCNIPKSFIELRAKMSSKKGDFKNELLTIEEAYYQDKLSRHEFKVEYIWLKCQYNQNIYMHHVDAYALKHHFRKGGKGVISKFLIDRENYDRRDF